MLITVHRWFANKSCPGRLALCETGRSGCEGYHSRLGSGNVEVISSGMQAGEFQGLTEEQVLAKVGPLFTADQKKIRDSCFGVYGSVYSGEPVMERVSLRLGANNCFGMKKSLSGNTWSGSVLGWCEHL